MMDVESEPTAKFATEGQWQDLIDHIKSNTSEIDKVKAASDVVDVVGTYAELEAYDKSNLTDKDVIKVLADENHDGQTTYYRYSTESQTFSLIGSVGPFYTEAETDALLKTEQDAREQADTAIREEMKQGLDGKVSILNTANGTSYINNESNGGIMKYTKPDGTNAKYTLFDGSDDAQTYTQIYIGNQDRTKEVRLNGTINGMYYSAGTAPLTLDDELATIGDIKASSDSLSNEFNTAIQAEADAREAKDTELEGKIDANTAQIETNTQGISDAKAEIAELDADKLSIDNLLGTAPITITKDAENSTQTVGITVDPTINASSTNPVQNKGIKTYVDDQIKTAISSVYRFKGNVATEAELPKADQVIGDVYNVEDTGDNYAWTGEAWDKLAGTVDLSDYALKSELPDMTMYATKEDAATKEELSALEAEVNTKQDTLKAGANITITENTISATDTNTTYTAGTGLKLTETEFSADTEVLATKEDITNIELTPGPEGPAGKDGATPEITMTATADATHLAEPKVTVTKSGEGATQTFALAFTGLMGEKGADGTTPDLSAYSTTEQMNAAIQEAIQSSVVEVAEYTDDEWKAFGFEMESA